MERLEEYEEAYAYISEIIREALARWQATPGKHMSKVGVSG
jgi:hypothetical protein